MRVVTIGLLTASFGFLPLAASGSESCDTSPIILEGQQLLDVLGSDDAGIEEMPNAKVQQMEIYSDPEQKVIVSDRQRTIEPIGVHVVLSANDIGDQYKKTVDANVPSSSCPNRYSVADEHLAPVGLHALEGGFSLQYQLYACLKTKSICTVFHHIYPEFYECWIDVNTFIYQKTFDFKTSLSLAIDHDNNKMTVSGDTVITNGQFEQSVLKFLTLLLQSMIPLDVRLGDVFELTKVSSNLNLDFISQIQNRLPTVKLGPVDLGRPTKQGFERLASKIDDETAKQIVEDLQKSLKLIDAETGVVAASGGPQFKIGMKTPPEQSLNSFNICFVLGQLRTKLKLADSRRNPVTAYIVQKGDNPWSIAQRLYGDGLYYPLILRKSGLSEKQARGMAIGTTLTVPPFHEVVEGRARYVEAGDSLWSIAATRLGAGKRFKEIEALNPGIKVPNKIYPLQELTLP